MAEKEWRVEIDIKMPEGWDEELVRGHVLRKFTDSAWPDVAEIVSARPLWTVTKDEMPADMTEKALTDLCRAVAPGSIACLVPPDQHGITHTPWCHLLDGHDGPHICGDFKWR